MSPVDLAVEPESATPIDSPVIELPVLENEGEDVPLLFQAPNLPEPLPECPVDPVVEPVEPEHNPEPPAVPAMLVPCPNCARRHAALPDPAPNIPDNVSLAQRHSKRTTGPPRDWWVVRPPPPPVESSDEEQQPDPAAALHSNLEEDHQDPEFAEVQFAGTAGVADPRSFKVAMNSAQKDDWWKAIVTEYTTVVASVLLLHLS
ncbi:hypothetical protein H0H92_012929 [Tricholoma furcatifolium]|nr:hypothetical protein H0H92_012929 [Tricholoma furcatifolium]